mmetsp:Transcript_59493/g.156736  ORF Transcript_59493/g.156736 Transcript_59493/m.156736 type:complete len:267 (-) Transcript_59493:273-1073(-)
MARGEAHTERAAAEASEPLLTSAPATSPAVWIDSSDFLRIAGWKIWTENLRWRRGDELRWPEPMQSAPALPMWILPLSLHASCSRASCDGLSPSSFDSLSGRLPGTEPACSRAVPRRLAAADISALSLARCAVAIIRANMAAVPKSASEKGMPERESSYLRLLRHRITPRMGCETSVGCCTVLVAMARHDCTPGDGCGLHAGGPSPRGELQLEWEASLHELPVDSSGCEKAREPSDILRPEPAPWKGGLDSCASSSMASGGNLWTG